MFEANKMHKKLLHFTLNYLIQTTYNQMNRHFNIAGPCIADRHYLLPSIKRLPSIVENIDKELFFVIHAARQSGKTTLLKHLEKEINDAGKYITLYCSLETVQELKDYKEGMPAILRAIKSNMVFHPVLKDFDFLEPIDLNDFTNSLRMGFSYLCQKLSKPLVVFFDEADCLSDSTLITFLRQLREGYIQRGSIPFIHSLALVGMRNIRDYRHHYSNGKTLGSASPFNIVSDALTLTNFTKDEIAILYQQHTDEKGQKVEENAIEKIHYYTEGQPWLVNAIGWEITQKIVREDFTVPITVELVDESAERIIMNRQTHIDSLLERLKEPRVRKIIEPVIMGLENVISIEEEDTRYCFDLGLIRDNKGKIEPSNAIYKEVIIRALTYNNQYHLIQKIKPIWINDNGTIDINGLLKGFQEFWRENSEIWIEKYEYKEAAPHLILQAFLQRVINGGGQIVREYAAGTKRFDLCILFNKNKYAIELKINYGPKTLPDGLTQLAEYMNKVGEKQGWLVIFDRSPDKSWDERIYWKTEKILGKKIEVVGC
jgi:hypothetical protein